MISVIVPIYNVEKYLAECLQSIVIQRNVDFEIICINDGSTDNSLYIATEYSKKYSNICVVSQENKGLSEARNIGLKYAKGEYIYFLDSDDYLANNQVLDFMNKYMKKYSLDILYMDAKTVFESEELEKKNDKIRNRYIRDKEYGLYKSGIELMADFERQNKNKGQVALRCFRKEFLVKNNLFFPTGYIYEDNLFGLKAAILAKTVMHKKYIAFCYRVRDESILQSESNVYKVVSSLAIYRNMVMFWKEHLEVGYFSEIYYAVDRIKSQTIRLYKELPASEKEKLQEISQEDKILLNTFLSSNIEEEINQYSLEKFNIKTDSRVLIYGSGKVGTAIITHLLRNRRVRVVGVVDRDASKKERLDFPVGEINLISKLEYDYVLICIKNVNVALEVKKELVTLGVENNKIRWCGSFIRKVNEQKRQQEYSKFVNRILTEEKKKLFLFGLPEHGNLGDYAIGIAEKFFFNQYFHKYQIVSITKDEWNVIKEELFDIIKPEDTLIITGGGFVGDMWPSGSVCREFVEWFPDNKIVIMPQTLTYLEGIENNEKVTEDLSWYFSHSNLHMLLRERNSYAKCCEIGYSDRCSLVPDMALSLDYRMKRNAEKTTKRTLLCLRADQERVFEDKEEIENILQKQGYEYDETDIHLNRYIPQEQGQYYLEKKIAELQQYDLVITDRLHGMILSWVAGVPVIAFDNSTHKVSGVYEWLKEDSQVWFCESAEVFEEVLRQTNNIQSHTQRVEFNTYFEALAKHIQKIIKE